MVASCAKRSCHLHFKLPWHHFCWAISGDLVGLSNHFWKACWKFRAIYIYIYIEWKHAHAHYSYKYYSTLTKWTRGHGIKRTNVLCPLIGGGGGLCTVDCFSSPRSIIHCSAISSFELILAWFYVSKSLHIVLCTLAYMKFCKIKSWDVVKKN